MWQSVILSFLVGALFGNGIPHFVKGITKDTYPCALGSGPIPNLVGGWICFVIAGFLIRWIDIQHYGKTALFTGALGMLAIGLFHAGPGAFGRKS